MSLRLASSLPLRAPAALRVSPLLKPSVARSHSLTLPPQHTHVSLTAFENGVPVKQVRDLTPVEKKWDFWTTSDAFAAFRHEGGLNSVPYGEAWIVERGSSKRVVKTGAAFLIPGLDKVKAIKNTQPIAMGIITPNTASKTGASVNGYAIVYLKVVDFIKSVSYVDPETNSTDSERAAAKLVRRVLEREIPTLSVEASGVSAADKTKLEEKVKSELLAKADEYGIEVLGVEFRGTFEATTNVPDKLRALDPPLEAPDAPGHGLKADYWADVLSPPFFEKKTYGSRKEVHTPATVTLEWVTPSPPDYHHFNELPRMTAAPPSAEKAVAKAH